jgi:DNA-binding CsgD family transcriptional regulator
MRYLRLLVRYTLGHWDEVLRESAEQARVRPAVGGHTLGPGLYVALARGDFGAAERARALLEGPFDWMARMVGGLVLTDAAALRGNAQEAVRWMRSSVEELTEAGTRPAVTVRLATLALSAVADTVAELRRAGDEAGVTHWTDTGAELLAEARWSAEHGFDALPQGPEGQAWLARAEAEWSRISTAAPDPAPWERAVAAFAYGDPYERARCRLRLAESLLAAGRREEAAAEADAVRREADRLGATLLRERLDDLARRGRLTDPAPSAGAGAAVLTPREQDVLRLLALGQSNRQIGEKLFISAKTASVHVSNILAKLGASSRTEAVAVAYRQGLVAPEPTASG